MDALRARQRVAVLNQVAGRVVQIERDVVGGDVLRGDDVDGRIAGHYPDVVHRAAARRRDRPREVSGSDRARGARKNGDDEDGPRKGGNGSSWAKAHLSSPTRPIRTPGACGKIGGQYTPIDAKWNLLHFESEMRSVQVS
jgi:hypothetical protein